MKKFFTIFLISVFIASCSSVDNKKDHNNLLKTWLLFSPKRVKEVYDHSLIKSYRIHSDCENGCPDVDVWQYRYKYKQKLLISDKPIATQKKYWKVSNEARIISMSLFGSDDSYYQGLLNYIESISYLKKANKIIDQVWGYETFTIRVYVPKRNDKNKELGLIKGELADYKVQALLDLGCEIAFVDNKLPEVKRDATFWRFMIMQENMKEGEKIRYLVRDVDMILTAAEVYTVADWIRSAKQYHRMHIVPICISPLTAGIFAGSHTYKSDLVEVYQSIKYYPYRFDYGDDELYLRDIIWPQMKRSGSVLTNYFERSSFMTSIASPYKNSCEEPTQTFCLKLNKDAQCEDHIIHDKKLSEGVIDAIGLRKNLQELIAKHSYLFDLELAKPERKFIYEVFKAK